MLKVDANNEDRKHGEEGGAKSDNLGILYIEVMCEIRDTEEAPLLLNN